MDFDWIDNAFDIFFVFSPMKQDKECKTKQKFRFRGRFLKPSPADLIKKIPIESPLKAFEDGSEFLWGFWSFASTHHSLFFMIYGLTAH